MHGFTQAKETQGTSAPRGRAYFASTVLVLMVALVAVACRPAENSASGAERPSPPTLADLFAKLEGTAAPSGDAVEIDTNKISRGDPNWPVWIYLAGEIHLKRRETGPARSAFRALVEWGAAAQRPGADGWGGSGLTAVALWRWLQILDDHGADAEEIERMLKVAADLQRTRLFFGMVRSGLLPALPLLEEGIARRLARVANKAGRPEAMALLLDFVNINSTGELDAMEQQLIGKMIRDKVVSPQRLDLFRYRRQLNQVKVYARKQEAAEVLRRLWEDSSAPAEVRAEAGYEWGNFYRKSESRKSDVVAALDSAYALSSGKGVVAEKALYRRAMVQGSVSPERRDIFFADMQRLLDDHPASRLADDALFQVATEQLYGAPAQPERAFETFAGLRDFPGASDWQDSAYFLAAMGHFDRGTRADLETADRLLAEYIGRYPDGVFRQRSLFWRARIAERRGDTAAAQRLFRAAVDAAPFEYHALRARMHLESGAEAIGMALPRPDSGIFGELRGAYRESRADGMLSGSTPYHERLRAAETNALYVRMRETVDDLGRRFRDRLDNIALHELDAEGLIPAVALLLAWRQDALAARDTQPTADNQLRLVAFLGRKLGDWPTAMLATAVPVDAQARRLRDLQHDPRYLATAYPGAAALAPLGESLAKWAWPIGGSTALGRSLMYAVIRRESAYFAGAISPVGALGLFQIMPLTFQQRRDCWRGGSEQTSASYLFDPDRNAQFWACWVRREFEPKARDDIALMLIRHHAGMGTLNEWRADWKGRTIENDLELKIDTLRFPATQIFVRHVLVDVAIAEAAGLFEAVGAVKGGPR